MIITMTCFDPTGEESFSSSFSASVFKPSRVALCRVLKPSFMPLPTHKSLLEDFPGDLPNLMASQVVLSRSDLSVSLGPCHKLESQNVVSKPKIPAV